MSDHELSVISLKILLNNCYTFHNEFVHENKQNQILISFFVVMS